MVMTKPQESIRETERESSERDNQSDGDAIDYSGEITNSVRTHVRDSKKEIRDSKKDTSDSKKQISDSKKTNDLKNEGDGEGHGVVISETDEHFVDNFQRIDRENHQKSHRVHVSKKSNNSNLDVPVDSDAMRLEHKSKVSK